MITDYASLKSEIALWLNRSDLVSVIPSFIQDAEAELRRDERTRKLQDRPSFTVSADNVSLPSDYQSIDTLSHDGPTYYGPIDIVGMSKLAELKRELGASGVPGYAAVLDKKLRFAPVPNATFNLHLTYWLAIESLSDATPTNWLLLEHPDIYRYATLLQSAPYLKADPRVDTWERLLNRKLEQLHQYTQNAQFSGKLVRRVMRPIGG